MVDSVKKYYAYVCFAACFIVLLWRAKMGFCWTDECFYVSTADRFYRGALPLVDEWYRTQLSSIIMVPFYAVYVAVVGSAAGVILYFRILYLILATAVSVVYYRVLSKDYPGYVALLSSLFVMAFAHLNVATFSYYMLSSVFLELSLIIIYDHKNTRKRYMLVLAGMLAALSVMCMPAFAAGYVIAVLAAALIGLATVFFNRHFEEKIPLDGKRLKDTILYTVIGTAIPALIFFVWLIAKTDIKYLFDTLPVALVDNEHSNTLGYYIRKPHRSLMEVFGLWTYPAYLLAAVTFVFQKPLAKRTLREIIVIADVVLFCIMSYISIGHTGYIQAVFFMFVIPLFFVSEKKNVRLFVLFVIPAAVVALTYCFTSSDFLYVMAIGFAIAAPAGVCIVSDLAGSFDKSALGKTFAGTLAALCIVCFAVTFTLRIKNVYRDAPLGQLTENIPNGVAKGLCTTGEHLGYYLDVCDMLDKYCGNERPFDIISGSKNGNVLFSKILPWGYIVSKPACGYPTTWRATAYDPFQLDMYYGGDPMRIPDIIFVLDKQYGSYDAAGDVGDDHDPNLDEMSDYWKDYIKSNGLSEHREKGAKIYYKD